jgi:S-DNA-T family DNA segregation ATPase FtsK/SpoIIIE
MSGEPQRRRSTAKKSGTKRRTSGKSARRQAPVRREVGAFVCLFLAIFTILACFRIHAAFLNLISALFQGLLGAGFYVLPFSFLLSFLILILHDGRPVALRVTCAFLLSLTVGALVHLAGGQQSAAWSLKMLGELWQSGVSGASGGLFAGFLAELLELAVSRIGAVIVLAAALVIELLTSLNMTIAGIVTAIRNRPRPEPYDEPQLEHPDPASVIVNHVAQKRAERAERAAEKKQRERVAADFDLPVDDPPLPVREPQEKRIIPPDQFILEKQTKNKKAQTASRPEPAPAPEPEPTLFPEKKDYQEQMDSLLESAPAQTPPVSEPKPEVPPLVVEPKPDTPPLVVDTKPAAAPAPAKPAEPAEPLKKGEVRQEARKIAQEIDAAPEPPQYQFPPYELLRAASGSAVDGTEEMRQNAERLNETLASFSIEAHIINVTRGPSVTRYELELSKGVKLSKVTNLADDIALALGASGVRIAAIPEKISVVGIEVPNKVVSTVFVREVIDSPEFKKNKSRISFAVGKDIGGSRIVGDIAKLPHMLIAGTTGSGKSVCMNSLIISLLYKAKPEEVKLIMVDPKMVELGVYNGIPHLLIPVVTDPKKAAGALQWAVTEMMRRYRFMADAGVRDLESFNKVAASTEEFEPMPQIVVVIDELADLMLVAAKEVEESICRVAQMGRAAGIHLVIATQRPSADVITGLMKANIPSRIAFAVASAMESRIILDTAGAEKLVGKGDMLYAPLGQGKPKRVQGCFITDGEVQDVVSFIKKSDTAQYSDEIMAEIEKKAEQSGKGSGSSIVTASEPSDDDGSDELLPAAVDVILETSQASVSMLQRRLKLGYARAARIMDEMEEKGIVGPFEGSKPRQLLITKDQWEQMKNGGADVGNPPVEDEIP